MPAATLIVDIEDKTKEIRTDSYPMSIGELVGLFRDGKLYIHPAFQRFFRWLPLQKSKFIESFLLGIPIPPIFVSQRANGIWDVIDGVQRISTILEFMGLLRDKDGNSLPASTLIGTEYFPSLGEKGRPHLMARSSNHAE